ncbi:Short-chain-enoyl-CoA hydratase [Sinobacterium norvegicum]|uniref:Short-chain-enoyl-CoA hydratase n=1 Tax=Sinobacterium norvegicum TaxID=1641715 RepID=A0ABN8EJ42_9GAMM|nr:enoyl-CoA hydratase [Sinobacterium norvegicum]CAH0992458.1 Short-chain-enoyl-CoA hydratase [Sinobacterium norvegicum]
MSDLLKLEKRGHVAIITLNNAPANTWTPESLHYLEEIVADLNVDRENYSLIIYSESEKFFSAGADLTRFNHDNKGLSFDFSRAFGSAFEALSNYQGVSIAAITGYAMGGGLEVALSCDVRICEEQAQMALPEASVGLLPCGLGSQQLSWLVGEGWAKRMILLGERLKSAQAEKIGLVSEVVATGTVLDRALELAAKVEKQSPTSVRYCKELIMAARDGDINSNYTKEREMFVRLWDSQDQKEGVGAFVEKRKPEWKNR